VSGHADVNGSDREQILEAMARYVRAVDDVELDLLAEIFTEATVWIRDTGPIQGLTAIVANIRSNVRAGPRNRHIVSNVSIEVRSDKATAVSDWYLMRPGRPWSIVGGGRYHDDLERLHGRWVFRQRKIQHLTPG
jgi:hypothetical protein